MTVKSFHSSAVSLRCFLFLLSLRSLSFTFQLKEESHELTGTVSIFTRKREAGCFFAFDGYRVWSGIEIA